MPLKGLGGYTQQCLDESRRRWLDLGKGAGALATVPFSFKIIAGSYERLLSVSASSPTSLELEWTLKPICIFPAHVSYIKTVAASPQGGKWLATGSGVTRRREHQSLGPQVTEGSRRAHAARRFYHPPFPLPSTIFFLLGSITHLTFHSRSHLISASEDGTLCIFRARDWRCYGR